MKKPDGKLLAFPGQVLDFDNLPTPPRRGCARNRLVCPTAGPYLYESYRRPLCAPIDPPKRAIRRVLVKGGGSGARRHDPGTHPQLARAIRRLQAALKPLESL